MIPVTHPSDPGRSLFQPRQPRAAKESRFVLQIAIGGSARHTPQPPVEKFRGRDLLGPATVVSGHPTVKWHVDLECDNEMKETSRRKKRFSNQTAGWAFVRPPQVSASLVRRTKPRPSCLMGVSGWVAGNDGTGDGITYACELGLPSMRLSWSQDGRLLLLYDQAKRIYLSVYDMLQGNGREMNSANVPRRALRSAENMCV